MNLQKSAFILIPLCISVAILFQNCGSGPSFHSLQSSSVAQNSLDSGNGSTYDGKLFGSREICPDGQRQTLVQIENKGEALLLRENCQEIVPRRVTINLEAHNPEYALVGSQALVLLEGQIQGAEIFCRGEQMRNYSDGTYRLVADAIISRNNTGALTASVRLGAYDQDGALKLDKDLDQLIASVNDVPTDTLVNIRASSADGNEQLHVFYQRLGEAPWAGSIAYHPRSEEAPVLPAPGSEPAFGDLKVENFPVRCYEE